MKLITSLQPVDNTIWLSRIGRAALIQLVSAYVWMIIALKMMIEVAYHNLTIL